MKERRTMKKAVIVSLLIIFMLVSASCASATFMNIEKLNQKQLSVDNTQSNNEKVSNPYGFSWIEVNVTEKYGTIDNPQYRSLPDVNLTLWACGLFIGLPLKWIYYTLWVHGRVDLPTSWPTQKGITDENGYCIIPHVYLGLYRLFACKDGFVDISSGLKGYVKIEMGGSWNNAYFTLTEEGGPWDSQNCQQSSPSEEPMNEYPDFPRNKMILIGNTNTVVIKPGFPRSLNITCEKGDMLIFGGQWKKSGYSTPVYVRFSSKEYTHFIAPEFFGFYKDGHIFGITYGNFQFW